MGITFSGMFGFGIVLFVAFETSAHLDHILFGNILGVVGSDILVALIIACLIIAFFAMFWRDLMLFSLDLVFPEETLIFMNKPVFQQNSYFFSSFDLLKIKETSTCLISNRNR
jgi:hypothetical protein